MQLDFSGPALVPKFLLTPMGAAGAWKPLTSFIIQLQSCLDRKTVTFKEQHFTTIKQLVFHAFVSWLAPKPTLASVWGFLWRVILSIYTADLFKVFKGCFPDPSSLEVIEIV